MEKYILRKNYISTYFEENKIIRARIAVKTKCDDWVDTERPVLVLLSVDSAIHRTVDGDLKMNALIGTIRSHVNGKVTILIADRAHIHSQSIQHQNNIKSAFESIMQKTHALTYRYRPYFDACDVAYWHAYIFEDEDFFPCLNFIKALYVEDPVFRDHLFRDIETSYTAERRTQYNDELLFWQKAQDDLFEQCAGFIVMAKKGYRFLFYTGKPYLSTEYVNRILLPSHQKIFWIDTYLSIEKKTKTHTFG